MKLKLFWVGIFIVIISFIGNYLYFLSKQLDQPIFLDHYYTHYFIQDEEIQFQLYYLTNKIDPVTISYIEFGDDIGYVANESQGYWNWMDDTHHVNYVQEYNHHYLMRDTVQIYTGTNVLNIEEGESLPFEKLNIYLSNGEQMVVDIGEIVFKKRPIEVQQSPLDFTMGSGSSNGISQETATVIEPATISDVKFNLPDSMKEFVDIKLYVGESNNYSRKNPNYQILDKTEVKWDEVEGIDLKKPIEPIHLEKDQWIQVITMIHNNNKSFLDFTIELNGTTKDGKTFQFMTHGHDSPYFSQSEINKLIKQKVGDTQ